MAFPHRFRALAGHWGRFWFDPVAFVDDLEAPIAHRMGLWLLYATTAVQPVAQRRGPKQTLQFDSEGVFELPAQAPCPRRLGVRVDGGASVVVALDADGLYLGSDTGSAQQDAVLATPAPWRRLRLYPAVPGSTASLTPLNAWSIYRVHRRRGADQITALRAAWPRSSRPERRVGPRAHAAWIARHPAPAAPPSSTTVTVLMPVYRSHPGHLQAAIHSVLEQDYPHRQLVLGLDGPAPAAVEAVVAAAAARPGVAVVRPDQRAGVAAATNAALQAATGDVVLLMDHDDRLHPCAIGHMAAAFDDPVVQAAYTDEDIIDYRGRRADPTFKTAFDAERLLAQNYVNHAFALRTDLMRRLGGLRHGLEGAQDHDLVLRTLEAAGRGAIRHIPLILYHWRLYAGGGSLSQSRPQGAEQARREVVAQHIQRLGLTAEVVAGPGGFNRLIWPAPNSVYLTTAPEGPPEQTDAPVIGFVDPALITPETGWMEALAALALRPGVGAVSPKLLTADGLVRGSALSWDAAGPRFVQQIDHEVEAANALCLFVERRKFEAAGGFAPDLAPGSRVADLCRRLTLRGWVTLSAPGVRVIAPA